MNQYKILLENPSVFVYQTLRVAAGLSPKNDDAAQRGISNSLFSVQILHNGDPVGMGRIIGDGGCFYQIVDIAVLPDHHRRGIGTMIMQEIARFITHEVPETAYVSLIADGSAQKLYTKFGFQPTAPKSIGMVLNRISSPPPIARYNRYKRAAGTTLKQKSNPLDSYKDNQNVPSVGHAAHGDPAIRTRQASLDTSKVVPSRRLSDIVFVDPFLNVKRLDR